MRPFTRKLGTVNEDEVVTIQAFDELPIFLVKSQNLHLQLLQSCQIPMVFVEGVFAMQALEFGQNKDLVDTHRKRTEAVE